MFYDNILLKEEVTSSNICRTTSCPAWQQRTCKPLTFYLPFHYITLTVLTMSHSYLNNIYMVKIMKNDKISQMRSNVNYKSRNCKSL